MNTRSVVIAILVGLLAAGAAYWWRSSRGGPAIDPPRPEAIADAGIRTLVERAVARVEEEPGDVARWYELGLVYLANGLGPEARTSLVQARALGEVSDRCGYYEALATEMAGDAESGVTSLEAFLADVPEYPPAHWRLGQWCQDLGRIDDAAAAFREAVRLSPGDSYPPIGLARVLLAQGEVDEAIEVLEGVIGWAQSNRGLAYQGLADAYRRAGRQEDALLAADQGEAGTPLVIDPWMSDLDRYRVGRPQRSRRAKELIDQRKYGEALALLEGLYAEDPTSRATLHNLALVYRRIGRFDEAVARYEEALQQVDGESAEGHNGLATSLMAKVSVESLPTDGPDMDRAREHIDLAIEQGPGEARGPGLLGHWYEMRGDREGALEAFEAARNLEAGAPEWPYQIGRMHFALERWEDAAVALGPVVTRDPAFRGDASLLLGLALLRSGDREGALRHLDSAARALPDDERVQDAMEEWAAGG